MQILVFTLLIVTFWQVHAGENDLWYTQGKFKPEQRVEFTISNNLDVDR